MEKLIAKLKNIWKDRQSFTFLLFVLSVYIFIVLPLLNEKLIGKMFFMAFYFLFLSSGINFLDRKKRTIIILLFIVAPFLILVSEIFFNSRWLILSVDLFITVYCVWLGYVILKRTFSKGHITINRVQGAVIVYLLSGFIFALIYHGIYQVNGASAFAGLKTFQRTEFMYFSLTTLTTMGYGDITAVNVFARSLANLEALNGQLYPAILIARLVSMEITTAWDG